jgi:signal recognition particle subunit SEC65
MEFHSMSLNELKAYCAKLPKGRRIKHYYIKSRAELCYLLSLPELPKEMQVEKLTIHDLRKMAKEKNIRGIWSLSKGELQDLLFPEHQEWDTSTVSTMQKDHQNQDNAKKHDSPQNADSKNVRTKNLK